MHADQTSRPGPALPGPVGIGLLLLLAAYAALSFTAAAHKGASFDEGEEISVGYDIWLHHDFRMEAANGDFIKRWATLPLLLSHPTFPGVDRPEWRAGEPYPLGFDFLFQSGNRPEWILRQTRAMVTLLGVATGLLVFFCSRELFGNAGGLISLGIFAFSPHMLAFGGIVSTEMSIGLGLLGSTWCVWHLLHRVTWGRLLGSLGFVGLAFLAKPTALLLLPITALLIAVRLIAGSALVLELELGRRKVVTSRRAQAAVFLALVALHGFAAWGSIWASYDFRYLASPNPADPGIVFRRQAYSDPIAPLSRELLGWSRRTHFLPEGYLHGILWLLGQNDQRAAFMEGEWKTGGWRGFFPYTMWAKGSPALLLLIPLGLLAWRRARARAAKAPSYYGATPFVVLIGVYATTAILQNINIGHRHILPLYPALYVLAGASVFLWSWGALWARAAAALILLAYGLDAAASYPDYLAYFSPLVGGPAAGYRHLVDSSLDWGMDLPGLRRWLDRHDPRNEIPLFLAYFGTDSPEYYQIKYECLLRVPDWQPHRIAQFQPGFYAISATLLEGVGTPVFGPWTAPAEEAYRHSAALLGTYGRVVAEERQSHSHQVSPAATERYVRQAATTEALAFCRLCAWLRHHGPPDSQVGHSILIWRLTDQDLRAALQGPPAELATPIRR